MEEINWGEKRGVADEAHWNIFVPRSGGDLVAPKIKREGVLNADYMFPDAKVLIEHKLFETEFASSKEFRTRFNALLEKYPDIDPLDKNGVLYRELIKLLIKPLRRIITKANKQIRATKLELGLNDWSGILLCVNDGFREVRPELVIGTLSHILAGTHFSSINAFIYLTNHFVEMPDSPYAMLFWHAAYSPEASDDLSEFVNDLGRKWRDFTVEQSDLDLGFSEEIDQVDLSQMSVVTGSKRNTPYTGE